MAIRSLLCCSLTTSRPLQGSVWFGNGTSFPDEVCDNITDPLYFHEERFVERQVAKLTYVSAALQAFPAILFTMFAGAWSDSYGRRTILFLPLVGFIARDIVFLIISQIHSAPPEYILFEALQDLTGGLPMLVLKFRLLLTSASLNIILCRWWELLHTYPTLPPSSLGRPGWQFWKCFT